MLIKSLITLFKQHWQIRECMRVCVCVCVCVRVCWGVSSSLGGLKGCDWWQGTLWRWRPTASADMIQSGLRRCLTSRYCPQQFLDPPEDEEPTALPADIRVQMFFFWYKTITTWPEREHRASSVCSVLLLAGSIQTKRSPWRLSKGLKLYFQAAPKENAAAQLWDELPRSWYHGLSYLLTV